MRAAASQRGSGSFLFGPRSSGESANESLSAVVFFILKRWAGRDCQFAHVFAELMLLCRLGDRQRGFESATLCLVEMNNTSRRDAPNIEENSSDVVSTRKSGVAPGRSAPCHWETRQFQPEPVCDWFRCGLPLFLWVFPLTSPTGGRPRWY